MLRIICNKIDSVSDRKKNKSIQIVNCLEKYSNIIKIILQVNIQWPNGKILG